MAGLCRVELLGGLRVVQGERVISRFSTQKTGLLLAYLALQMDRAHPRELLVELLWPDVVPRAGRASLNVALSSLRRQLEPPGILPGVVIAASRFSVQLNPAAVSTDVGAFSAALDAARRAGEGPDRERPLTQAVALYRGHLLPGFYEDWVLTEQRRLAELFFQASHRLTTLLVEAGDLGRALEHAHRAVSLDPSRIEGHLEVIRLLVAAGQHTAALRQRREAEKMLVSEWGVVPPLLAERLHRLLPETVPDRGVCRLDPTSPSSRAAHTEPRESETPGLASPAVADALCVLPPQLTRFFGREKECGWLHERLHSMEVRLVTLTGPGGAGKTRLSIEVAGRLAADGVSVCFVSLVHLADPRVLIDTVLESLRVPRTPGIDAIEDVVAAMSGRRWLLILDNFEHLVDHGSPSVRLLLARVPALTCLVTSRQRLNLTEEIELPIAPLPTPSASETPEALLKNDSVQLFVDRAQMVRPDFQVTARNASAVAALCAGLEGIPLALELAAARVQLLSPAQMLAQLAHRLDFLVSRRRDAPQRHRTLRAALDWSYRLLPPDQQRLFAKLSVFRGGWTVEAAEAVCCPPDPPDTPAPSGAPRVQELLEQLAESSLVLTAERDQEMRFRTLETIREFAAEQLPSSDLSAARRRHCAYYLRLAEVAEPGLRATADRDWLERLESERDNLRAALEWCATPDGDRQMGLRLAAHLWFFWYVRGYAAEGRRWLAEVLAGAETADVPTRAKAHYGAGALAFGEGDFPSMGRHNEESLALYRRADDAGGIAYALVGVAVWREHQGDLQHARELFEESLRIARTTSDRWLLAYSLNNLAGFLRRVGEYRSASALFEECLTLAEEYGLAHFISQPLRDLAMMAQSQGEYEKAAALFRRSLTLRREEKFLRGVAECLEGLAEVACAQGRFVRAAVLFGAADTLRRDIRSALWPDTREYERSVTAARQNLGEDAFAAAWAEGGTISWEQAVVYALGDKETAE